jgi:hypothetical protein
MGANAERFSHRQRGAKVRNIHADFVHHSPSHSPSISLNFDDATRGAIASRGNVMDRQATVVVASAGSQQRLRHPGCALQALAFRQARLQPG